MTPKRTLSELERELFAAQARQPSLESQLDPAERAAIEDLRKKNAVFWSAHDENAMRFALEKQLAAQRVAVGRSRTSRPVSPSRWLGPAFAMACVALVWVQVEPGREPAREPALKAAPTDDQARLPTTRSKGSARLGLRVLQLEGTTYRPLATGDVAHPGDVIQLQIEGSLLHAKMVVFSIDGRGTVTLHYPKYSGERLAQAGMLPRSFELDDAPRFERFYLVSAPDLMVDEVLQSAQRLAAGPGAEATELEFPDHFPKDVAQSTFLLRKEVP